MFEDVELQDLQKFLNNATPDDDFNVEEYITAYSNHGIKNYKEKLQESLQQLQQEAECMLNVLQQKDGILKLAYNSQFTELYQEIKTIHNQLGKLETAYKIMSDLAGIVKNSREVRK